MWISHIDLRWQRFQPGEGFSQVNSLLYILLCKMDALLSSNTRHAWRHLSPQRLSPPLYWKFIDDMHLTLSSVKHFGSQIPPSLAYPLYCPIRVWGICTACVVWGFLRLRFTRTRPDQKPLEISGKMPSDFNGLWIRSLMSFSAIMKLGKKLVAEVKNLKEQTCIATCWCISLTLHFFGKDSGSALSTWVQLRNRDTAWHFTSGGVTAFRPLQGEANAMIDNAFS